MRLPSRRQALQFPGISLPARSASGPQQLRCDVAEQPSVNRHQVRSHPNRTVDLLLVLATIAVVLAILFYQLVRPLALPLFFAAVVAMLVQPIHRRIGRFVARPSMAFGGHRHGGAGCRGHRGAAGGHHLLGSPSSMMCESALDTKDSEASTSTTLPWLADRRIDDLLTRGGGSIGTDSERLRTAFGGVRSTIWSRRSSPAACKHLAASRVSC